MNNFQINFTGIKTTLNDADWVCRTVRKNFPAISPNRLYYENPKLISNNERLYDFINEKGKVLQQDRNDRKFLKSPFKILKEIIYSVKEHKVAHCGEYSSLAELIARMNGVDNCYRFLMKDYNHVFLLITKKPLKDGIKLNDIVIDPWLGIVAKVRDIFMKYKNEYGKIFPFENNESVVLRLKKPLSLDKKEIEYFKEKYPELVFKSKDGHKLMEFK